MWVYVLLLIVRCTDCLNQTQILSYILTKLAVIRCCCNFHFFCRAVENVSSTVTTGKLSLICVYCSRCQSWIPRPCFNHRLTSPSDNIIHMQTIIITIIRQNLGRNEIMTYLFWAHSEMSPACFTSSTLKWWPSLLPLLSAMVPSEVRLIASSPLLLWSHASPSYICIHHEPIHLSPSTSF